MRAGARSSRPPVAGSFSASRIRVVLNHDEQTSRRRTMVVTIKAIFRDGVFRPLEVPLVPENQEVELAVTWPAPATADVSPTSFASLQGMWSHLGDETVDRLEGDLADMRRQTGHRLEHIVTALD